MYLLDIYSELKITKKWIGNSRFKRSLVQYIDLSTMYDDI